MNALRGKNLDSGTPIQLGLSPCNMIYKCDIGRSLRECTMSPWSIMSGIHK